MLGGRAKYMNHSMEPSRAVLSVPLEPEAIGDSGDRRSTAMSRYERMNYFERLVELHLIYAMRGDEDRTTVMTIDEAINWAEAELEALSAADRD